MIGGVDSLNITPGLKVPINTTYNFELIQENTK